MNRLCSAVIAVELMLASTATSNVKWETEVLASNRRHTAIMYSIVGVGFFRGQWSSDFKSVRDKWLKQHPRASILPVCEYPGNERVPNSKIVFIWIVQEKDNLVVDLIRHGCLVTDYVRVLQESTIAVSPSSYALFLKEAAAAERTAKAAKLGVWADERNERKADD
jgi:hypothetical protein